MKKLLAAIFSLVMVTVFAVAGYYWSLLNKIESTDPAVWASAIEQFELQDRKNAAATNSVLFVGSSSIATFDGLEQLMAPRVIVKRGFGGASVADVRHYRQQLVDVYEPAIVVIYVGAIDVYYHHPNAPQKVVTKLRALLDEILESNPLAEVYYVAIRPSPFDPERWSDIDYVNKAVLEIAESTQQLSFVDANDSVRSENGELRKDLYKFDRMHLNEEGNRKWWHALRQGLNLPEEFE